MAIRINWVRTNPGDTPTKGSYWRSVEGRFWITPIFRSTTWLDGYMLTDNANHKMTMRLGGILECKQTALRRVEKELTMELKDA
jgi:hypothetical protein